MKATKTKSPLLPLASIEEFCAAVRDTLAPLADAQRAGPMAAYMKHHFTYLGIASLARRLAIKPLLPWLSQASPEHLLALAAALWELPEREYQYVAVDVLAHFQRRLEEKHVEALLELAQQKYWWDSVDALAGVIAKILLRHQTQHPGPIAVMERAIVHPNLWVRRIAMLHQIGWRLAIDVPRLQDYARRLAPERDFFIRKAIGWALRDFARHDPAGVRAFLEEMKPHFSGLTYREAGKHL